MSQPPFVTDAAPPLHRSLNLWTAFVVMFVGVVLTWQSHTLGLTTDEVSYIECHEKLLGWLGDFQRLGISENLSPKRLADGWYFGQFYNKNLPLIGIVSLISDSIFGLLDTRPASYRWGNVLFFAATAGLIFRWVTAKSSRGAGLVAVAALIGMPRLTANAALLSLDPLIGGLWIWGTWLVTRSGKGWGNPIAFAITVGLGFATKPTFWFLIPVWLAWGIAIFRKESWRLIAATIIFGGITAYLVLPMWWNNPVAGLWGYWNLLRAESGWQGVDAYYLGKVYQVAGEGKAPWHAVIVLTLITTPLWILCLWLAGILRWFREPAGTEPRILWLIGFGILPLIMMLPGTPCHDGIRMFLPSMLFGAMLAGSGWQLLLDRFVVKSASKGLIISAVVLLMAPVMVWWNQPAGLSYYNLLTGGLQGATEAGRTNSRGVLSSPPTFEATYWWEVMTVGNWKEMQDRIPAGKSVWIYPDFIGKDLLKKWGTLREDLKFAGTPREADYLLLYGRMGRLMQAESHPMEVWFQQMPPVWEVKVRGARLVTLIKRP